LIQNEKNSKLRLIEATATPLASIFGSGFLIIIPILAAAVGVYAVLAMLGICLLAYAVGSVIRFNIRYAEPVLIRQTASKTTLIWERLSDFALILAYIVSVCLYLRIFSSFLLAGLGIDNVFHEQVITTLVIASIAIVGAFKGLKALAAMEEWALWVTLAIIVGLLLAFTHYDYHTFLQGNLHWPVTPEHTVWQVTTILAGTLIVVQGFETSRYLHGQFDAKTRIHSSRLAQWIATAVYLLFVGLVTPLMYLISGEIDDSALVSIVAQVSVLLPVALMFVAVMSQFSAAVADTLAGGGNIKEVSKQRVKEKPAYVLICCIAIVLVWSASTMEIVTLASRAFALYYLLQCFVAITISRVWKQRLGMFVLALLLAFIAIFAVPVGTYTTIAS